MATFGRVAMMLFVITILAMLNRVLQETLGWPELAGGQVFARNISGWLMASAYYNLWYRLTERE